MTTRQEINFLDYNIGTVALEIQKMVRKGWRLDEDRPLCLYGLMWEVWFIRDASEEQLEADAVERAKPSRAEILANARKAKAEKAAAKDASNNE